MRRGCGPYNLVLPTANAAFLTIGSAAVGPVAPFPERPYLGRLRRSTDRELSGLPSQCEKDSVGETCPEDGNDDPELARPFATPRIDIGIACWHARAERQPKKPAEKHQARDPGKDVKRSTHSYPPIAITVIPVSKECLQVGRVQNGRYNDQRGGSPLKAGSRDIRSRCPPRALVRPPRRRPSSALCSRFSHGQAGFEPLAGCRTHCR